MRICKSVYDLFSLFVLITSTNSYRFSDRIFPLEGHGFRTEEVAAKNRSGSTEQGVTIMDGLACYRLTNDQECR
jgi:hypothetical protein